MDVKTAKSHLRILGFTQVDAHPDIFIRSNDNARLMYSNRFNNKWVCAYLPMKNAKELRILIEQLNGC